MLPQLGSLRKLLRHHLPPDGQRYAMMIGGVSRGWIQAITFLFFAISARFLGLDDFGRFTLAMVFVNVVQSYLYSGIYEFLLKVSPDRGLDRTLLLLNFAFAVVGAALSGIAGVVIGMLTHDPMIGTLAIVLAPSALLAAANAASEAVMLRSLNYGLYNAIWVASETVACIVGILAILRGGGVEALVLYRYVQAALAMLLFLVLGRIRFPGRFQYGEIGDLMRFSAPIYLSRMVGTASEYGADLLVGLLVGPAATGIYRLASRIVSGLTEMLYQPVRVIAWARSSRVAGRPARLVLILAQVAALGATGLFPLAVVIAFVARDGILIGLGSAWLPAASVVVILMLGRAIGLFELLLEPLLVGLGRGNLLLWTRFASVTLLFLLLVLTARHGTDFVAMARAASTVVSAAVCISVMIAIAGPVRLWKSVRPGVIAALSCAAAFLPAFFYVSGDAMLDGCLYVLALIGSVALIAFQYRRQRTANRRAVVVSGQIGSEI